MFDEIFACVDGSPLAEKILPLAALLASRLNAKLTALRVVANEAEIAAQQSYMADAVRPYSAQYRIVLADDPARAIVAELADNSRAVAAITTHGRTDWAEVVV